MNTANSRIQMVLSQVPSWLTEISKQLAQVKGVAGVALGGSRARGMAKSDSDFDICIFYHQQEFDWEKIKAIARQVDDSGDPQGMAGPGEWGPWVNGGAWLKVQGNRTDFLLRDYDRVAQVVSESEQGRFSTHYQIGNPNAFYSYIWMSEVAFNVSLQDPHREYEQLYSRTLVYPVALQKIIIEKFIFEAEFTFGLLSKLRGRDDNYYLMGLTFRFVSCLVQVLFAINKQYFINEKGSVELASGFTYVPAQFAEKVRQVSSSIPLPSLREDWLLKMSSLLEEVQALTVKR